MLVAPSGERQLVELKAVDAAWPLVGEVASVAPCPDPPRSAAEALAPRSGTGRGPALAWPSTRSCCRPAAGPPRHCTGDTVRLGNATFTVRGDADQPSRTASPRRSMLGPRVLIAAAALPATGLIVPGSMVQYALRAALPTRRRHRR